MTTKILITTIPMRLLVISILDLCSKMKDASIEHAKNLRELITKTTQENLSSFDFSI